jgi:hypothetical protein
MTTRQHRWTVAELGISDASITARVGYGPGRAPAYFHEVVASLLEECPNHARVVGGFHVLPPEEVAWRDGGLRLATQHLNLSPVVRAALGEADLEGAALFVTTAGPGLTTWYESLAHTDQTLAAYAVDTIGSALAEGAAEAVAEELTRWAKKQGLNTTNRYSPGYCHWDVAEQRQLFELLPPRFCGVTLTESAMMVPVKSVSGLIGLGREATNKPHECQHCPAPCNHQVGNEESVG